MWFIFAIGGTLAWGLSDMLYKMGTSEDDPHSFLKIGIWVGIIMGAVSFLLLPFSESGLPLNQLLTASTGAVLSSLFYIISMLVGYAGLRYLELSIISPIENASGAFSMLGILAFFLATGKISHIWDAMAPLDLIGTLCIVLGMIFLAVVEKKLSQASKPQDAEKLSQAPKLQVAEKIEKLVQTSDQRNKTSAGASAQTSDQRNKTSAGTSVQTSDQRNKTSAGTSAQMPDQRNKTSAGASAQTLDPDKKYRIGVVALLFPIGYCILDSLGTAINGIALDTEVGEALGEIDNQIIYGLFWLAAGILMWIYLWIKEKQPYIPFRKSEKIRIFSGCTETAGNVLYIYAMAANPVLTAPIIASYCIVSLILSRLILKEKLMKNQYLCIAFIVVGIVIMGISEGLAS